MKVENKVISFNYLPSSIPVTTRSFQITSTIHSKRNYCLGTFFNAIASFFRRLFCIKPKPLVTDLPPKKETIPAKKEVVNYSKAIETLIKTKGGFSLNQVTQFFKPLALDKVVNVSSQFADYYLKEDASVKTLLELAANTQLTAEELTKNFDSIQSVINSHHHFGTALNANFKRHGKEFAKKQTSKLREGEVLVDMPNYPELDKTSKSVFWNLGMKYRKFFEALHKNEAFKNFEPLQPFYKEYLKPPPKESKKLRNEVSN